MLNALLGRKVGMTQVFGPNGTVIPVTVIEAGPCIVTQIKTIAHDGYEAVQIGFEQTILKNVTRPALGHLGHSLPLLKAQRKRLQAYQQEQRAKSKAQSEESEKREAAAEAGTEKKDKQIEKLLKVQEKRQRRGGPKTPGQSDRTRAPGSIGSGTKPGRVLKGTRMAGQMGNVRVTAKKLQVIQSDPERNLLLVKGSVPGANGGLLMIKKHVMR